MAVSNISSFSLPCHILDANNAQCKTFHSPFFMWGNASSHFKRNRMIRCIAVEPVEKTVYMTKVPRNANFAKLQAGYLFPEITRRCSVHMQKYPDAKATRLGIGYTAEPIPEVITSAMAQHARALSTTDSYSGYGVEQGEKVGGRASNWPLEVNLEIYTKGNAVLKSEIERADFDLDINRWLRSSRVQWYPGHIAKAEKELKHQLKLMDVIIEVRDARIPMATGHPEMDLWIGDKKKILVLNKVDMISTTDKNAWAAYFSKQGLTVVLANGQLGMGTSKLARVAKSLAINVNDKRRAKGLLPRATRAGVVGYPNVGKSSLINRLLKRRVCATAPRPGVTRQLKWFRIGQDLDLLDSPGILPMRFSDQAAATKLAICDDIGERSYTVVGVAAILVEILKQHPKAGAEVLKKRYKINADCCSGETYVKALAQRLFNGDVSQAAFRVLSDFRKGKFGFLILERPPCSTM